MYEHPYLSRRITEFEQEQMVRAAERQRFIAEHADQIVARQAGRMRRLLRGLLTRAVSPADAGAAGAPAEPATACRTAAAR